LSTQQEQKTLQEISSQKVEIKEEENRVFKPLRKYFEKT
jgi:hypothetical protein